MDSRGFVVFSKMKWCKGMWTSLTVVVEGMRIIRRSCHTGRQIGRSNEDLRWMLVIRFAAILGEP